MSSLYLDFDLDRARVCVGGTAALTGGESRHAASVSRVRVGEIIAIGNGQGLVVTGPVSGVEPDRVVITIQDVSVTEPVTQAIWLVQALAKGDRDESAVQAACELGVDGVIPWAAQRSIVKWDGAKVRKGQDRWSAIVREATKQSVRAFLPDVAPLVTTKQLALLAGSSRMLVLAPDALTKLSDIVFAGDGSEPSEDIVLVVGPEGGIGQGEIGQLLAAGATAVKLGDTVLRTGTAGPAAIAALSVLLGRW